MDRIQSLQIFIRVAEMKSFTQAAESLGMPKASVSAYIQSLENEVGTRLLHRTTRHVQLTQDGAVFYERSKDMLADMEELSSMFQENPASLSGRIRVDMPSRMARFRVLPKLKDFIQQYPKIEIELGSTDREVDLVHEGYDCVVRVGPLDDSSLMSRKIGEMRTINCASKDYLKTHGTPKSLADLKKHYLVGYVSTLGEKPEGFEYWSEDRYHSLPMKNLVTVNNAESYVSACKGGLGIIQIPVHTLDEDLESGSLVEILPRLKSEPMATHIVYPHRRNLPKRVKVFMDWLEKLIKDSNR